MDTAAYYLVSQSCEPWTESMSKSHEQIRTAHTYITAKCNESLKLTIVSVNECGMNNASNSISIRVVTSDSDPILTAALLVPSATSVTILTLVISLLSISLFSISLFSISLRPRNNRLSGTMQVSKFREDSKSTCEADYMGLPSTAIIGK